MAMTIKKDRAAAAPTSHADASSSDVSRSFETLFLEHWSHVYGLLLRLVGDQAEAEDLALETFVRLYQRDPAARDSGSPAFNVGGWLNRVATNLGLNALRTWKRRQRHEIAPPQEEMADQHTDSPAEIFAAEEERRRVRQILSEMNPRQSRLLVLRYSGLAYQEIAAALEVSATSIGPLLFRAESEFEKRYRAAYPEGG